MFSLAPVHYYNYYKENYLLYKTLESKLFQIFICQPFFMHFCLLLNKLFRTSYIVVTNRIYYIFEEQETKVE